jgi:hypothetical protein
MRTPVGKECSYFFGDYYRGRNVEECRLLKAANQQWTPDLCKTCPVPSIEIANACQFMRLRGTATRPLTAWLQRRVQVTAYCEKSHRDVPEPHVGCGECHGLPFEFKLKE